MKKNDKSFQNFLKKLNIKENYIILHIKLLEYPSLLRNIDNFWNNIRNGIGQNKTFIVPTFNPNFVKKKNWNKNLTPSKSGFFSEYFRTNISQRRTNNPIHSVCIFGKDFDNIPEHTSSSSFGKGSIWEWLCKSKNVCNLSIGVGVEGGATFLHYSEELFKVDYRFKKKFFGNIILKNRKIKKKFLYFARKKFNGIYIKNNWSYPQKDLIKNKVLKEYKFKKISFYKMNTFHASDFILKKLKDNSSYLIKK